MWGKQSFWGAPRVGKRPRQVAPSAPTIPWTVDATLGWACPANAAEWDAMIASEPGNADLAAWSTPTSIYNCQDAAAPIADTVGAFTLSTHGTSGHLYQQDVTGVSRKALVSTAGVTNAWRNFDIALPDLTDTSCLMIVYVKLPDTPSGPNIIQMGGVTPAAVRHNSTTGYIGAVSGGNAVAGTINESGKIIPVVLKVDRASGVQVVYTQREKLSPTIAALAGRSMYLGASGTGGNYAFLYAARLDGTIAERTDAQVKALLTKLIGTVPAWS